MSELPPDEPTSISIEQLLLREDTWLGHSGRFTSRKVVSTGYSGLDDGLMNQGWPLNSLVEVCQSMMQAEWQLCLPALRELPGLVVLLNPPATPFCQAFMQANVDLERLVVVKASDKPDFVACFIELARAGVGTLLAWQPEDQLSYTELRKCSLATTEATGLCIMFRPLEAQQQNSPAGLRVFAQLVPNGLEITAFKQRGFLQTHQPRPVIIPLPDVWQPALPFYALNQKYVASKPQPNRRLASVTPLPVRGKS